MNHQPVYYTEHRVRFEFRKCRKLVEKQKAGTVYICLYVKGHEIELFSSQIRCAAADWQGRGKPRAPESVKQLERALVLIKESAYNAARSLHADGKVITPSAIREEMEYASQPLLRAEEVFKKFLDFKRQQIGPDRAELRSVGQICKGTFRQYEHRWHAFCLFLKARRKEKILLSAIDQPLIQQFYYSMLNQSVSASTATKRVKIVTELCQWAYREGLIREFRLGGFRGQALAANLPYNVSEEEVLRIESIEMPTTLACVRDGWLLARELCLHFGDYIDLKPQHFVVDKQGRLLFDKARNKQEAGRNIRQASIVSERAMSIWYRYGQQIPCKMHNSGYGRYLKEIGAVAELSQPLIFSHARDSGIFRLVASGCPEFVIRLAAGWTTMKQLSRYVNHDRRLLETYQAPAVYMGHAVEQASPYGSLVRRDKSVLPVTVDEKSLWSSS
ncbi:phage integrase SAM-like domain-containing protein [Spirosoma endophyticum]|uniref:Phage integrase, N-terminal SAM-like domain n=1 Tax=Spirosoma endophyticum TaxID=662367 RepID=A0A1I2H6Z7_9BACT|nr:phage integrase SAM-like domain-containing protein [Spirosoma endophyticum]SFF24757.1 Phage integrase, N-terminal SAM-like domain [Spirosoma endophyticum]